MHQLTDGEFVDLLRRRDIRIGGKNGKLHINAPTGAINEKIRSELARRKPGLLNFLEKDEQGRHDREAAPMPILPSGTVEPAPLTFAQQRLWLIDSFHPGNIAYNIPEAFRIEGAFDIEILGRAVNALVQRHHILRIHVEEVRGVPFQQFDPTLTVPIEFTDLSSIEGEREEQRLRRAIHREATRSFDLHRSPLVRFHVFRLREASHVVLTNIHHLIADRWSLRILRRELSQLYFEIAENIPSTLPALPIQYADYARWEQQQVNTSTFQRQIDYWKHRLSGAPARLELPFARPHPVTPSFAGAVEPCCIDAALTARLKRLAQSENASLFMTVLAAFSVLLHRYTREEDICIGSPISGRSRIETESLIGLFLNLLVLRCKPQSGLTFRELLRHSRTTALEAYENSQAPFQKLVIDLHPDRDHGVSPLFQIFFALDAEMPEQDGGIAQLDAYPSIAKFDLTLQLSEYADQLSGGFEYRTDLFQASDLARMSRHFSTLLESIVDEPDRAIGELDLLTSEEQRSLLSRFNRMELDYPHNQGIHQLFECQAALTPNETAVISATESTSYAELNRRANRIAHALRELGAGPDCLIGVCMKRTTDVIAALLGVLKTGAAYVPLDPEYPQQRLAFMIADSKLNAVVTHSDLLGRLPDYSGPLLCLDRDRAEIARLSPSNPDVSVNPSNAAYVIYTSGSTGTPKGVVIEHRNTVSFLYWAKSVFDPEMLKSVLASTSICFDLSIFEIFLPLSFGHTVILAEDILELPRHPAASLVTLVNTVPSAIEALLKVGGLPPSVRVVNTAGEFLSTALADQIYATAHVTHVFDLYGPTETTTYSTFALRLAGAHATIGYPVANTRIYLLDANLQLVPIGIPGEIFIAGDGVTRGYLDRPELTAQRFISLAHLGESSRAYRTGDLGRYLDDDSLEYCGRIDHQVKLRGHRIELGEIEAALREYPAIAEAAVLLLEPSAAGASLSGFVTLADATKPLDPANVISFLRQRLPGYMVVSSIVTLENLPRTLNGKLDRNALAAIPTEPDAPLSLRLPRTNTEQQLANIWEHCFERSPIGINEDFFQIGGHSLLAFQIFTEIESRMGKRLMLASLFEAPTIEALAVLIGEGAPELPPSPDLT